MLVKNECHTHYSFVSSCFFPSPLVRLGPAINDRFMALKVLERSANWPSFQLHCSLRYLTPCQVIFYPKKSFRSFLGHVLWFLLWMLFFSSVGFFSHDPHCKKNKSHGKWRELGPQVAQVNFVQATEIVLVTFILILPCNQAHLCLCFSFS